MTAHLEADLPTLDEKDERARRAVKAFRALQPTLSAYARILTRRQDVRVQMHAGSNGMTDGKVIYYRPPMALGDITPHNRQLCDKRDENYQQRCRACATREDVLVTVYHEIAHISFGTFDRPSSADQAKLIEEAVKGLNSEYARRVEDRILATPEYRRDTFMKMCGLVSNFMPIIFNALEDARINTSQSKARPGTKAMFDAQNWKVFNEGVEHPDHATGGTKTTMWTDQPQNSQFIVGILVKASGYKDYSNWFIPPVVEALDDEEMTRLCNQVSTLRSAQAVYQLTFPILARAHELGFCIDKSIEPDPEPEESKDEESSDDGDDSEESGSSGDSDSDDSDDDAESGDKGASSDTDADSEGSESGEGESSDSSDDDEGSADQPSGRGDSDAESDSDIDEEGNDSSVDEGADSDGNGTSDRISDDGREDQDGPGDPDNSESSEGDAVDEDTEGSSSGNEGRGSSPDFGETSEGDSADSSRDDGKSDSGSGFDDEDSSSGDSDGEATDSTPSDGGLEDAEGSTSEDSSVDLGDDLIDTGADEGYGGTQKEEDKSWDDVPLGDADDANVKLLKWSGHEPPERAAEAERTADNQTMDKAIIQGLYFEEPSRNVFGIRVHKYGVPSYVTDDGEPTDYSRWDMNRAWSNDWGTTSGGAGEFASEERILGDALLKMRVAFSENKKGAITRHQKSGKVDARVLGKRAWSGDERIFKKKTQPGKRDYFVVIGIDISGSTYGVNIDLAKRAAYAQAELLTRMGITFVIYAHSGTLHAPAGGRVHGLDVDFYLIKDVHEAWNTEIQKRLSTIGPEAANLDGHSVEFYRKICDTRNESHKIILYYSDGKMPAENHDEELDILTREIKLCKSRRYTLLGIGIRTDSPARHGLDTVQIDAVEDLPKIAKQLQKYLAVKE